MDIQAVVDFINQAGFPIACVCMLFWVLLKEQEQHKTESDKLTEALHNNTLTMQKLVDKLDGVFSHDKN